MPSTNRTLFLALVVAQAAHSVEEYYFRLYDVLAPARFVSGLFTDNLAVGFAIVNSALVALGLWCYFYRVRLDTSDAQVWMWGWVIVEMANGAGHTALAIAAGGYFPGIFTAPVLFALACFLAYRLLHVRASNGADSLEDP